MTTYRNALPQLGEELFLTDGGLETTLIFHNGIDLPHFASFVLMRDEDGTTALRGYYESYLDIASKSGTGFILESPTWRASADWGVKLGYDAAALADVNRRSIELLEHLRERYADRAGPIVISGNVGPRGDGYVAGEQMSADEAAEYHAAQIGTFAGTNADMVCAITLTYAQEAIGIVNAAAAHGIPVVIGFTTETDGRLPNGQALHDAIEEVDAATNSAAAYFMVNCAHTEHFDDALQAGAHWAGRVRGVRANASRLSHAELDEAEELDDGDPGEFGRLYRRLRQRLPQLSVFGGCCGTDHRHIDEVSTALCPAAM
ncbi:MAG: homocysteine S-methyltransferase family protein [Woeseiaceae bacterium]